MSRKIKIALFTLVVAVALSSLALADVVNLDDVIVDGSLCVGFDCVNGESFDFDTIRLAENNVRIRFQDTSSSSSFPTTDWQLTANDAANGGGNYFGIEELSASTMPFRVEAGAGDNALYVAAGGRVGVGTSLPTQDVHVRSDNTPGLRFEQDGTGGFTPQSWDVGANEANFFVRNVTADTAPFTIQVGAPDGAMEIESGGDVTISGVLNQGSSRSIKHGIRTVDRAAVLDAVTKLDVARWRYRADPGQSTHIGPMAEDFHAAFGLGADAAHISAVDTSGVALASIQALNDKLEQQNDRLRGDNARMQSRLERLEAAVARLSAKREVPR